MKQEYDQSGIYVFIRDNGQMSDEKILKAFGLIDAQKTYQTECSDYGKFELYSIRRSEAWTCLLDHFSYRFWHENTMKSVFKEIAKIYDLYYCLIGDADESFEFTYYEMGKLIRQLVVADPYYDATRLKVTENTGTILEIEKTALKEKDPLKKVMAIAKFLGIDVTANKRKTTTYEVALSSWQKRFI